MLLSAFWGFNGGGNFEHFKCNLSNKGKKIISKRKKKKNGASCPQYKKGITKKVCKLKD